MAFLGPVCQSSPLSSTKAASTATVYSPGVFTLTSCCAEKKSRTGVTVCTAVSTGGMFVSSTVWNDLYFLLLVMWFDGMDFYKFFLCSLETMWWYEKIW